MTTSQRLAVIITALPVERDAVREHLHSIEEEPALNGSIYRRGIFDERSEPWDVILAEIGAGNQSAAAEAERVIAFYKPQIAIFVGVAGSIKDVKHGDVVASAKVYGYESGKDQDEGFKPRPDVQLPGYDLEQRARHESGEPDWLERIKHHDFERRNPIAKLGPIAAGEKVLASNRSEIFQFIRNTYGDALAVEMEGHGFLLGVRMNQPVTGIVIRGISDCISDKNEADDLDWQPIASRHAAAFAFQILAKQAASAGGSPAHLDQAIKQSPGVQKLDTYWKALRSIAEHTLDATVFTASREKEIDAVTKWLVDPATSLFMNSAGYSEGLDFLAALSSTESLKSLADALIISDILAWHKFSAWSRPLILIAAPGLQLQATDISGAILSGHHVFVSGVLTATPSSERQQLRRQDHYSLKKSLLSCGYSEARAKSLAQACCGSSAILKRLITRHPETQFPAWCREDVRSTLAPFALIGGWTHIEDAVQRARATLGVRPPCDTLVVTELLKCTSEDLADLVARWTLGSEPLLLRFGDSVLVTSREDSWFLLGGSIDRGLLKRFCDVASLVLEEDNPALQLHPEQRWLACLYGKSQELSEELRRSIVETLALMTTYPPAQDPKLDFRGAVNTVLERALPAHAPWERWASFSENLTVVAEAAPEFFLSRVEDDINSISPELPKLFQDRTYSIFASSTHSALLWSLEMLAWSPEYLSRVAVALTKLAKHDPGGAYANRPANSLRDIFLTWLWNTNASAAERIQALRRVVETEPDIGWKLLANLIPGNMPSNSRHTHMPRWRTWADGWSTEKIGGDFFEYRIAIAEVVADVAEMDPRKWAEVFEGMLRISHNITEFVFTALNEIANTDHDNDPAVFELWRKLREALVRHEKHAQAAWALPKSLRLRLSEICDRLAPSDPVLLYSHLFNHEPPDLPDEGDFAEKLREYEVILRKERLAALKQILSTAGFSGVSRLFESTSAANMVGHLIGEERLVRVEEIGLPKALDQAKGGLFIFVSAYLLARHEREGSNLLRDFDTDGWSAEQLATMACCLVFGRDTWDWIHQHGPEVLRSYWTRVEGYFRTPDLMSVRFACESLIGAQRPIAAARTIFSAVYDQVPVPSDFIAKTLEAVFNSGNAERERSSSFAHYNLQQLVKTLQQDTSFDRARLARIEWGLLGVLDRDSSSVQPVTLIGELSSHPDLFVYFLTVAFPDRNDGPPGSPSSDKNTAMINNAKDILSRISPLPGTDDSNTFNEAVFRSWTESVRSLAKESDRLEECDRTLGEIIARASYSDQTDWPSPSVSRYMEQIGTDRLFQGFAYAVWTSREIFRSSSWEGGIHERTIATRCRKLAEYNRPYSHKLAKKFIEIAEGYEGRARIEDEDAEREKLGR